MTRSVLMLEFNELSPVLMDRFIAEGHLPAFKRLRDRSATFITEAGESDEGLNPWVQWVTVHTGATAAEHGIEKLGEAHKLQLPTIADEVSRAGGTVWLCGSMNVHPIGRVRGPVLPDPWSVDATPQPRDLEPFFRFVSANVQEHTSSRPPLSRRDALAFVRFWATHGGSPSTAVAAARQLTSERFRRAPRWRRAELLDRIQWDVFRHYYRALRPRFATFFSNSTAHFQHLHWDELGVDAERSLVLHGYKKMDELVDQALALAGGDATVVLCTALSQSGNEDNTYEGFYRPRDLASIAGQLGLANVRAASPVMAEQFHLLFTDELAAEVAEQSLADVSLNGDRVFDVHRSDDDLLVGCRFTAPRPKGHTVTLDDGSARPLAELFYWTSAPRQGDHHPDGLFWIADETPPGFRGRVPLTAVAPTLLALLGVDRPPSMKDELIASGQCD